MHLMTKYFGQIDYDPTEVLSFPNGIFGFEEEKQFLLLPFHGGGGNLLCFQSVGTPSLAFVAMNPFLWIQIMLLFCQMRNSTLWGSPPARTCAIMSCVSSGSL